MSGAERSRAESITTLGSLQVRNWFIAGDEDFTEAPLGWAAACAEQFNKSGLQASTDEKVAQAWKLRVGDPAAELAIKGPRVAASIIYQSKNMRLNKKDPIVIYFDAEAKKVKCLVPVKRNYAGAQQNAKAVLEAFVGVLAAKTQEAAQAKAKAEAEVKAEAEAQAKADAEAQAKADAEAQAKAEAQAAKAAARRAALKTRVAALMANGQICSIDDPAKVKGIWLSLLGDAELKKQLENLTSASEISLKKGEADEDYDAVITTKTTEGVANTTKITTSDTGSLLCLTDDEGNLRAPENEVEAKLLAVMAARWALKVKTYMASSGTEQTMGLSIFDNTCPLKFVAAFIIAAKSVDGWLTFDLSRELWGNLVAEHVAARRDDASAETNLMKVVGALGRVVMQKNYDKNTSVFTEISTDLLGVREARPARSTATLMQAGRQPQEVSGGKPELPTPVG